MKRLAPLLGLAALLTAPAFAQAPGEPAGQRAALDLTLREACFQTGGPCEAPVATASGLERREEDEGSSAAPPSRGFYFTATSNRTGAFWAPGRAGADASVQRNRVPIGDQSVGVATRVGEGELSLGYVNREVGHRVGAQSLSRRDDFAGVSFTLRR